MKDRSWIISLILYSITFLYSSFGDKEEGKRIKERRKKKKKKRGKTHSSP